MSGLVHEELYVNDKRATISQAQSEAMALIDRGLPEFSIRRSKTLQDTLGLNATVSGFTELPITSHSYDPVWEDDINFMTCNYAISEDNARMSNDSYYEEWMYLKDDLKDKYAIQLNLTDDEKDSMTFNDAYMYSDVVLSQQFEGVE